MGRWWLDLPDLGFTLCTIIGGRCHQYHFCQDKRFVATNTFDYQHKSMLVAPKVLSRQNYVCRNKYLSWQTCVCCDKSMFVTTQLCRDKYLSWQKFCHFCRNKHNFVVTKLLSRQAYFWHVCYYKTFVMTKKIQLMAAPANDSAQLIT